MSRGFSQQEGEDYDKTLTPVIEEIVPVFMKTTRTTMIHIQYEMQGEQSPYLKLSGSWCSTLVVSWRHDYCSITPIKEEELSSVSVIEPLSVLDETVVVINKRSYSQILAATVRMKQSMYLILSYLHERIKSTFSIIHSKFQMKMFL